MKIYSSFFFSHSLMNYLSLLYNPYLRFELNAVWPKETFSSEGNATDLHVSSNKQLNHLKSNLKLTFL